MLRATVDAAAMVARYSELARGREGVNEERLVQRADAAARLEAANQRTRVRIYRSHPFIVIRDVLTSLSRERVIVTEFVHGA